MSHSTSSPGQAGGAERLRQAGLRLPDVIAQSVGFIGPVFSSALVLPLVVGAGLYGAGVATPVAIILAAIGMAAIGWIIAEYAKRIHSAGALYDYVSDGFGDRAGFVGGWLYYAATMVLTTAIVVLIGGITSDFLKSTWNIGIPYWVLDLVYLVVLLALIYVGIQISVRVQLVLVTISAIIVGAFFVYIVIKGGTSGNSVRPFEPSESADGWKGIFFGIIYAILVFTGFETAANLGEETRDPGKSIPRAIILSVVVVGVFYLLAAYAQDIGFGLNAKSWASSPAPLFQLAAPGAFGSSWFLDLVQILVILDIAAVGLGCAVCTVRGVFAMARDGRIPSGLRKVSPTFGTPAAAAALVGVISLCFVAAIRLDHGVFPLNGQPEYFPLFAWMSGLGGTALAVVYGAVTLGAIRGLRGHVNPVMLTGAVVIGAVAAAGAIYGSIDGAVYPNELWIWFILGWIVIGAAIVAVKHGRGTFAVADSKQRAPVRAAVKLTG
jgi:amino acid transporter